MIVSFAFSFKHNLITSQQLLVCETFSKLILRLGFDFCGNVSFFLKSQRRSIDEPHFIKL